MAAISQNPGAQNGARYIAELVCKAVSPDSGKLGRDQWDVLAQVSRALGLTVNPIALRILVAILCMPLPSRFIA